MTAKNHLKETIALELPSAATLGAVCHGPGRNSGAFVIKNPSKPGTLSGIGNRSQTPGTLPGFPDKTQGESEGLLWPR